MTPEDDEAGITLVEIMLSLLVLGTVLTAFFGVITGGLQSLSESRARQAASQVATEVIEQLRSRAPSEIAMYTPAVADGSEFDPNSLSCGSPAVAGTFDPDGAGPLGCEAVVSSTQGAVTGLAPFQGPAATATVDGLTVRTIATAATSPGVPASTVRVTVVLDYTLPGGSEQIRRSSLFAEVPRA